MSPTIHIPLQNAEYGFQSLSIKECFHIQFRSKFTPEWVLKPSNRLAIMTMLNQELSGDNYAVTYDTDTATVKFIGQLVLRGYGEYAPIMQLLMEIVATQPELITLDLKEITFLNSSGINMFSKFLLSLRKHKDIQLVIVGTQAVPWQSKSLKNMPKLLPRVQLRFE